MELNSIDIKSYLILAILLAIGPAVMGGILIRSYNPAIAFAALAICLVSAAVFVVLAYFFQKRSVDIFDDHIHVRSSFYSHSIPLKDITAIEEVDSDILGIRTNGVGLPGFKSGWFQARPSKATIFVDAAGEGRLVAVQVGNVINTAIRFSDNDAAIDKLKKSATHEMKGRL